MKKFCGIVGILHLVVVSVFIFTPPLHAQRAVSPGRLATAPVVMTTVELSADEAALIPEGLRAVPLYAPETLPFSGTFYSLQMTNYPPLPGNINNLPCWSLGDGTWLLDDVTLDYQALQEETMAASSSMRSMGMDLPSMDGGGDSGVGGPNSFFAMDTNQLWLEITNVTGGLAYLDLHNASNTVYAVWSATSFPAGWQVETEVWPTNSSVMPFTVPVLNRTNLFMRAEDWTGVDSNSDGVPDWWVWKYFATLALNATNLDSGGTNTLGYDYTNHIDPNVIKFTLSVTNLYVNQTAVPVQINLAGGVPSYYAVLVNDTNPADANWQAYAGTNLAVNLGSTNGLYVVNVGLRGLPVDSTQTWHAVTFTKDTTALTLVLTNLTALSGSRPFIDPAGYASRALSGIHYTVVDANGVTNSGGGLVVAQGWNMADPYHVTNWIQCVDLALALGTNHISIQATDWVGNVAVTNFSYVFSTNGDTTAPAISLAWPQNGTHISGNSFTVQGTLDDDTATAELQYTDILTLQQALIARKMPRARV